MGCVLQGSAWVRFGTQDFVLAFYQLVYIPRLNSYLCSGAICVHSCDFAVCCPLSGDGEGHSASLCLRDLGWAEPKCIDGLVPAGGACEPRAWTKLFSRSSILVQG